MAQSPEVFLIGCVIEPPADASPATMGFKAWNLLRMARLGIPVPPAFVLGTRYCSEFAAATDGLPPGGRELLAGALRQLEAASGLTFGSQRRPLLVSVRSGAPVSMPGMMETLLDIGLTDATLPGLLRLSGNPRLAWDSYRRLVQGFGEIVHGLAPQAFEAATTAHLRSAGAARIEELDFRQLRQLTASFLEVFEAGAGQPFPQSPQQQLELAVRAVFASWSADKARLYRQSCGIPDSLGTAVTVQQMVFGNAGGTSGSGVAFTRDPATGRRHLYLDFAVNAQGEDVVSGRWALADRHDLAARLPRIHQEIGEVAGRLEREFGDAQEFEFTVQAGRLYLLQTRSAKRTPLAALRIAVEMVTEGLLTPRQALLHLEGIHLDQIEEISVEGGPDAPVAATGVPAGIGVATGRVALDPGRAVALAAAGEPVILVREDVATADLEGLQAAAGILTARGGRTSHAAVVARQLDKACIVGCSALEVAADGHSCQIAAHRVREGDLLTLDAGHGTVYLGRPRVRRRRPTALLREVENWRRETPITR